MAFNDNIREEELKNQVASTIFFSYDCDRIIGNIDFCVAPHVKHVKKEQAEKAEELPALPLGPPSFLWAEAKKGRANLTHALIQLVLTIGRARTFNRHDPPKYLAAFDAHEITLVPFGEVYPIYQLNDFNWKATASDHHTEEFHRLEELLGETLAAHRITLPWHAQDTGDTGNRTGAVGDAGRPGGTTPTTPPIAPELKTFIRQNFTYGGPTVRLAIDRHNFITVYSRWREVVMPTIGVQWDEVKGYGIIDADFYLADLLSQENRSILEKLNVLLMDDRYRLSEGRAKTGGRLFSEVLFSDGGQQHRAFWNAYQRPPDAVYWDYIMERRDLLVPGDVREVKGAFFTPERWVKLSQKYLADYLGPNWQQEYYVWDCAAGTGNLLAGLTNPQNIWASTLDQADVDVMHQLIAKNSRVADAPPQLFTNHVFQFDFLNDDFSKLPEELRRIVEDPEKRKKLVVYINPPYAEASNSKQLSKTGNNRAGLAMQNRIYTRYFDDIGKATRELFALFSIRIYKEIPGCVLGEFSTLKIHQGPSFGKFLSSFRAKLEKIFLVPAYTFDNVKGKFPIGFSIWDTASEEGFTSILAERYNAEGVLEGTQRISTTVGKRLINSWLATLPRAIGEEQIGLLGAQGNDFQHQGVINIQHELPMNAKYNLPTGYIGAVSLIPNCIYYAVRHCIKATWYNDRENFLWPNDGWLSDPEFQSDCLAFTLLHGQNRISSHEGANAWIPFREQRVGITHAYASHFMVDFLDGRLPATGNDGGSLLDEGQATGYPTGQTPISFSPEAQALLDAGLALWQYYHAQPNAEVNASYYDIRRHFQGVNAKGRMNAKSDDTEYMRLVEAIREKRQILGDKIALKVYEYGFLPN